METYVVEQPLEGRLSQCPSHPTDPVAAGCATGLVVLELKHSHKCSRRNPMAAWLAFLLLPGPGVCT